MAAGHIVLTILKYIYVYHKLFLHDEALVTMNDIIHSSLFFIKIIIQC